MSEGNKLPANGKTKKKKISEESEIAALIHVETVWAPVLRAMWGWNTAAGKKQTKCHFNLSLQKGARSFLSFPSTISAPTPHVNSALSARWKRELTGADKRCGGGCHGKGALWAALKAESCPTTRHHIDTLAIRPQKRTMTRQPTSPAPRRLNKTTAGRSSVKVRMVFLGAMFPPLTCCVEI